MAVCCVNETGAQQPSSLGASGFYRNHQRMIFLRAQSISVASTSFVHTYPSASEIQPIKVGLVAHF